MGIILIILTVFIVFFIISGVRIVPQKEAWIIERFGKYHKTLEAGLNFIVPFIDHVRAKVSLKEQIIDIPPQEVITKDNVMVNIDTLCYFTIIDPVAATYNIERLVYAITQTVQTNLRDIVGSMELDDILSSREKINRRIRESLQGASKSWGMLIDRVEVKEVKPPKNIADAMSMLMEADRKKKAMILEAEGKRRSQELEAEGFKLAKMQEAEAIERIGQAQANAVRSVGEAVNDPQLAGLLLLGDNYIKALEELSKSNNSKIVVLPASVEGLLSLIGKEKKE